MCFEFSEEEYRSVFTILEKGEKTKFFCQPGIRSWWFQNTNGAELRIVFGRNKQLIVSRVNLNRKRQGTMTAIYNLLREIGAAHGYNKIVIQSVLTSEMEQWCRKNHFKPDPNTSFEMEDGIRGDFIISI